MTWDKRHVSSDMWHRTHDTYSMVIIFSKFQVPSYYSFGLIEKWHLRGISIDNRQYFFLLLWGTHGPQVVKGYKKRSSGNFLVHFISPWQNLHIWLVLMFSIISKSTSFLLKLNLHCKWHNFICVSNTSESLLLKIKKKCNFHYTSPYANSV